MDRQELAGRQQLDRFLTDEFDAQIAPMGSPEAIRILIRKTDEFRAAKRAMDAGLITERAVRDFTSELMLRFVAGRKFRYETTLAALAALCEAYFAPFAEELLIDLAALKLPEIGHAIRVARACLQHRMKQPRMRGRTFVVCKTYWVTRPDMGQVTAAPRLRTKIQVQTYAVA
jgi:hypothetical protein